MDKCLNINCNNLVKRKGNKYCSYSCSATNRDKDYWDRIKKTNLKRYGVSFPFQSSAIQEKIKQSNLEKYGTKYLSNLPEIKDQMEQTNLNKYGVKNPLQNKEIQEKIKQTNLERYGVENPFQSSKIQDKIKQTNILKYGVDNPRKNEVIKEKIKQTLLKNYGVENITQNIFFKEKSKLKNLKNNYYKLKEKFKDKIEFLFNQEDYLGTGNGDKKYQFKCLSCNRVFEGLFYCGFLPRCLNCSPLYSGTSISEKQISEYLTSLNISFEEKNRTILSPLELDIYIPEREIAIEFNGLYWHSEISNKKDKHYHLDKTNKCLEKGIQLIHIFEDEWINKQDIVKSIILSKLGLNTKISGRDTEFREVNKKEAKTFLQNNHLQGYNQQIKYCFGLYFEDTLVELVTIGCSRYNKKYDYELNRSCTLLNTTVIGGFEKLMKNLPLQGKIISYVDRRYFNGNSYKDWECMKKAPPNYFYIFNNILERQSRLKFQKHKLPKLFPDVYDKDLTEWEIMQLAGYDRIWDCGNLVYSRIL